MSTPSKKPAIKARKSLDICVFCAANNWPEKYTKQLIEFSLLLASRGHRLISGGSNTGLMKLVASNVQAAGGKVVGVPFTSLVESVYEAADEIIMTETIADRKSMMLSRCDAIVILVGGSGTLDEMTEVIELKRHSVHHKPIAVLNTDGFYKYLRLHYKQIQTDGLLLPHTIDKLVHFAETPLAALKYVEQNS